MTLTPSIARTAIPASHVLGRKLDSIPFSPYHLLVILVLGFVALVDGYDGSMTGSLLVLAKQPLHITPGEIRVLAVAAALTACIGGFVAAAISDYWSRRTVLLLGVVADQLLHADDPAGAKRRAIDHHSFVDRYCRRLCRLGGVPDRRRADAGAAPAHLWRDLRDDAGQCRSPWCCSSAFCSPATRTVSG